MDYCPALIRPDRLVVVTGDRFWKKGMPYGRKRGSLPGSGHLSSPSVPCG